MKHCTTSLLLAGFVSVSACASPTIHRESSQITGLRNPSVHFMVDNTRALPTSGSFNWGFAVFQVADLPELNLADVDERIHEALLSTLTKKGFVKTGTGPDFLVSYALASGAGIDEATLNGAYDGAVQPPPPASGNAQQPIQYRRGTLIVDIAETKTKHLLWRGAIMADVDLSVSDEEKRLRCERAVEELLKHYPKP